MIFKFHFFNKNGSSNLVWDMLKNLNKLTFDMNDTIYLDNSLANTIYLINEGYVKLFAENGFAFSSYRGGSNFGDSEVILAIKYNGTAKAMKKSQFYVIKKKHFDELMEDYPVVKM